MGEDDSVAGGIVLRHNPSSRRQAHQEWRTYAMSLLEEAGAVLSEHALCKRCLGRLFGGLSGGMSNLERGEAILTTLTLSVCKDVLDGKEGSTKLARKLVAQFGVAPLEDLLVGRGQRPVRRIRRSCEICKGGLEDIEALAQRIVEDLSGYEFRTFQVGTIVPAEIERKEDKIRSRFGLRYSESIRSEFSREVGKILERAVPGKRYSPRPDIRIELNPYSGDVRFFSKKLLVEGEVKILDDGAAVFAKVCPVCRGKGCEECGHTGKEKGDSFEFVFGSKLMSLTGGKRWRFGMKRLGEDRIRFRMSLIRPEKKSLPIEDLLKDVNSVLEKRFVLVDVKLSH